MECFMKNMPYEKAFRGPKVDLLASFPNSTNIGETPCPTHSCVDQVRSLEVLVHLPALIKLPFILLKYTCRNFRQGTSVMIFW